VGKFEALRNSGFFDFGMTAQKISEILKKRFMKFSISVQLSMFEGIMGKDRSGIVLSEKALPQK